MAPSVFSTRELSPRDQLEAWRSWHAAMVDMAPSQDAPVEGFAAESQLWMLDGMAIGCVSAPGLRAVRTAAHLRRDPTDHWVLTVGLSAATKVSVNGNTYSVPVRAPFVASLGEACESIRAQDDRLHLYIARDRFPALTRILDRARGPLAGSLASLLTDYLVLLQRALPDLPETDLPRLPRAIAAMVASCIDTSAFREPVATTQIDHTLLQRVRQVVRRKMSSPSLGPMSICRDIGISRSRLYRLMEGEGGVARYIQNLRLDACHVALCDPVDTRTISAIAEAHGFYDPSSFSRVFRRKFALTPGDVRAAAQAGVAVAGAKRATATIGRATLHDWLRAL